MSCRFQMMIDGKQLIPRSCQKCGLFGKCQEGLSDPLKEKNMEKSRVQQVTKDEDTHQYVSVQDADPDETYNTTEEHLSSWQKEWRRIGMTLEFDAYLAVPGEGRLLSNDAAINAYTIAAVLHAQALRRVDK